MFFISANQHTSFSNPYRRKNDLQETHDNTEKLFPRGVSPQMLHSNDKLGSRRAVSCLRSIFFNQIHMNIFFGFSNNQVLKLRRSFLQINADLFFLFRFPRVHLHKIMFDRKNKKFTEKF